MNPEIKIVVEGTEIKLNSNIVEPEQIANVLLEAAKAVIQQMAKSRPIIQTPVPRLVMQ